MPNGELFESINLISVLTRLTLAVMLGGILGFERGRKRLPGIGPGDDHGRIPGGALPDR